MVGDRTYLMDVLRGLLASWVVVHHIVLSSGFDPDVYPWRLFTHHGQEPVLVFFILSGFAITKSLRTRPQRWSSFLIARFWRIYPVYLIALLIGAGGWWYADHRGGALFAALGNLRFENWTPEDDSPGWLHVLLHLVQLHGVVPSAWLPHGDTSLVAPAWSLSTEFQFYALAPLLCLVLLHRSSGKRLAVALLLTAAVVWPNLAGHRLISPANVLRYLDLFILGMVGAIAHGSSLRGRLGYCLLTVFVAAAGLLSGRVIVATAVVVWLTVWLSSTSGPVERLIDSWMGRMGLFVGALSFPLYIIHYPVERLLLISLTDLLPSNRAIFLTVWVLATLVVSYGGAALLHRYAEVPGTRYGKWIARRRDQAVSPRLDATSCVGGWFGHRPAPAAPAIAAGLTSKK